ncbi:MAG TPA: NlpC/P60 family protein [Acidimicrobiales bacterium]|nr:NlpC/P60 family protein [Acidimicrobiales bacterium]
MLALAVTTGITSLVVVPPRLASADQISDAQAQASALTAKIAAEQQQIQSLTSQYDTATYKVGQLNTQIAASQAQLAKDQAAVNKDQGELKTHAVADYMSNGTSNQFTQMFTGDNNAAGIHNEYSAIASGNVTNTVDQLHTAQTQLKAQQDALQQQQSQATAEANAASSAKNQATQLAASDASALDGVNANIKNLVAQQQAAAAAAAQAAANAKLASAQAAAASAQTAASRSTSSGGSGGGGVSVSFSPPPPTSSGAAGAVQAAQGEIGVPYTWGGSSPSTGFDCSGLVEWAYAQVGISLPHYSGAQYDDTTHIPLGDIAPGDILFYGPGGSDHEAMYIGGGEMVEAPYTGATVTDNPIRTGDGFVGVGRVG